MTKQEIEKRIEQLETIHAVRVENWGPDSEEAQSVLSGILDLNRKWLEVDMKENNKKGE